MDNEFVKAFEELRHSVVEWGTLSVQALGFRKTIEYNRIIFHVSGRSVIADLAPLAYLDLVQEIEDGMVHTAVTSLYERLYPLLQCKHRWSPLSADAQSEIICQSFALSPNSLIHVCADCMGLCIESPQSPLPQCGRG